jgi:flagellar biosynthesis GTPase FlhF
MDNLIPNLDATSQADLLIFWHRHQGGRAAYLIGLSGSGMRTTTAKLANYAANKATAMSLRLAGKISAAMTYERICEDIYETLPNEVKW